MKINYDMIRDFNGGMLTGEEIKRQVDLGNIMIDPFDKSRINPNSYNLTLSNKLKVYSHFVEHVKKEEYEELSRVYSFPTIISKIKKDDQDYYLIKRRDNFAQYLNTRAENYTVDIDIPETGLILYPEMLYIGSTIERTSTDKFIPAINGRSSGGRLGISVHICAGFGDIGFDGTWTLEIQVIHPVKVYPGLEIAQISFDTPYGDTSKLYRGRYYKQEGPTSSRMHLNKTED